MADTSFDLHAKKYESQLSQLLQPFGTSQATFARKKTSILQSMNKKKSPSFLDFGCGIGGMIEAIENDFEIFQLLVCFAFLIFVIT